MLDMTVTVTVFLCCLKYPLELFPNTLIVLLPPESLHELEDTDLDALMADLVADLNATEMKLAAEIEGLKVPSPPPPDLPPPDLPPPPKGLSPQASPASSASRASSTSSNTSATSPLPPPPSQSSKPTKVGVTVCSQ